jgi:chemotaxis protein methyltransferase CheR
MSEPLSETGLSRLSGFLEAQLGLHFGQERRADLERGILSACGEFGFQDADACLEWLLSKPLNKQQIAVLARHLTVGETYFFRDPNSFQTLEKQILPELIRSRRDSTRQLRFWSAGCCTGEEAYSLAVLVTRLIPDWRDWQVSILATDLNVQFLDEAAAGEFSEWSFRDAPGWLKAEYFRPSGKGRYQILPFLKQGVTFSYLNLARDVYPSLFNHTHAMDVIFCRNVLMYFSPEQAHRVVAQLEHCLVEGGWLLGSATESLYFAAARLTAVSFPGVTFYRKTSVPQLALADTTQLPAPATAKRPKPTPALRAKRSPPDHAAAKGPSSGGEDDYTQARSWYEQGRYTEAASGLLRFLAEHPAAGQAMVLMARVYADQGQLAEALRWSDRAIAADKLNAGAHYLRATILQEQGTLNEAVQSLNRALYLDHNFILAHFGLGSLARKQGQPQVAERHFGQALELLETCPPGEPVPESEGVTADRLREIIASMRGDAGREERAVTNYSARG